VFDISLSRLAFHFRQAVLETLDKPSRISIRLLKGRRITLRGERCTDI
jgi:hypothetical protein